jgi:O-antigen/teichoic acid export membrane protein
MGVVGLLTSSTGLITGLTNFGLGTSAVKNISEATATNDNERISTVILVMRRLLWVTGLLGALVTLIFSPLLSEFTFGNKDYTLAFVWISITLLFNQLSTGELVILQALRHLQNLAKANVYGSFVGLLITIPLYYKFGIEGIVPVIIITSFVTLFFSWYFAKKVKLENTSVSYTKTVAEGKSMMVMGFMISLSGLITLIAAYLLRIFINRTGNVADVGFYSAGFTIINTYVGMVFTAMGTDYYPRLSVVASDDEQCKQLINQQSEIALLILAPILIAFLIFVNWAIIILYSSQFLSITGMVYWATMGIFFKAVSWAIAFVFLAKGVGKLYFWNEFFGSIYFLLFSLLGYYYGGLTGLGVSFLISYILYLIQVFFIAKVKYEFSFSPSFMQIFVIQFLLAMAGFAVVYLINQPYTYILGVILIGFSCWYSYKELESRIGVKEIIQGVLEKFKKK